MPLYDNFDVLSAVQAGGQGFRFKKEEFPEAR
jgi:hypothetical protein